MTGAGIGGGETAAVGDRSVDRLGEVEDGGVGNSCRVEDRAQLGHRVTGGELLDLGAQGVIVVRTVGIGGETRVDEELRFAERGCEDAEEFVVGDGDDDETVGSGIGVEWRARSGAGCPRDSVSTRRHGWPCSSAAWQA